MRPTLTSEADCPASVPASRRCRRRSAAAGWEEARDHQRDNGSLGGAGGEAFGGVLFRWCRFRTCGPGRRGSRVRLRSGIRRRHRCRPAMVASGGSVAGPFETRSAPSSRDCSSGIKKAGPRRLFVARRLLRLQRRSVGRVRGRRCGRWCRRNRNRRCRRRRDRCSAAIRWPRW